MEIQKANIELLTSNVISQIIPPQFLHVLTERLSEGALMNMIICDEVPVGFVTLIDLTTNELMTVIHQNHRRKGFVFKTCVRTINECFQELKLKYITVKTITNSPSHLLAKKLGFKEEKIVNEETYMRLTEPSWEGIAHFHITDKEQERIREACFDLASKVNWTLKTDSENIVNQVDKVAVMTDKVYDVSIYYLLANIPLGCNVEMMIRIVNYVTDVHAIPVSGCDIDWYQNTLYTLVGLVCPNYEIGDEDFDFVEIDLRRRLNKEI